MKIIFFSILLFATRVSFSQDPDGPTIKSLFNEALKNGRSYDMLHHLTKNIGQRLSGSNGAATAVDWGRTAMIDAGVDSVWLQPVLVPQWVRGQKEIGQVINSKTKETFPLNICALGGSVGTGPVGVTAKIVEVKSFAELAQLGAKNIQGKIVFFNRPMDATLINTFAAYSGAVDQRGKGPSIAAAYGAVAVIVRSMGSNLEDYPHTGALQYGADTTQIPAAAISTRHAEVLSKLIKEDKGLQLYIETHFHKLDDVPSFNVVGQIKGTTYPEEIIAVGGHLDSWDLAQGAHEMVQGVFRR